MIALSLVTSSTGAFHASSLLETVGVAEVDGFYRFPSFKSCKAERCQRDYSAMKTTGLKSKFAGIYATGTRGTRPHSIWLECDRRWRRRKGLWVKDLAT